MSGMLNYVQYIDNVKQDKNLIETTTVSNAYYYYINIIKTGMHP